MSAKHNIQDVLVCEFLVEFVGEEKGGEGDAGGSWCAEVCEVELCEAFWAGIEC